MDESVFEAISLYIRRDVGQRIRQAREELKMSQADLAEAMGRRQAYISEMETAKTEPNVTTLIELGRMLQKPVTFFLPPHMRDQSKQPIKVEELTPEEGAIIKALREVEPEYNYYLAIHLLKSLAEYEKHSQEAADDYFSQSL